MYKINLTLLVSIMLLSCSEKQYSFEFIELNTPGTSSLRAIHAVDDKIIWTSGSQGQVYLSEDGGENWIPRPVPGCADTEFRSLHAWDAQHALVFDVSPQGRAFMTSDAGASWELVYHSPLEGAFFNSLKFANDKQGIAISDPIDEQVFVLQTEDGGLKWKRLPTLPPSDQGEINFAASNTCIEYLPSGQVYIVTGGSRSRILSSSDHGYTWSFMDTPMLTGASAGLFSVSFATPETGVAVGGDFNEVDRDGCRAIFSEDGGNTWHKAETMPAAYRSCVVAIDKEFHFAIGKTGCDYSVDQGKNWTFIDSTGYYTASAVQGENIIYLAGSDGRVGRVIVRKE